MNQPEVNISFDWLTITFPVDDDEADYIATFGKSVRSLSINSFFKFFKSLLPDIDFTNFTDEGKVPYYDSMFLYDEHIRFKYYGPQNANGIATHALELKGDGCRSIEMHNIDWLSLLEYCYINNLNISVLDIACDIFTDKYFTIEQLESKFRKGEYISNYKTFNIIEGRKNGVYSGDTIYLGRRGSDHVTFYDKRFERYHRGYIVDSNFWLRIEVRLKSKTRSFIAELINYGMDHLPELYFRILSQMVEFKTKGNNKQKSRWTIWRPWERFIQGNQKLHLVNQGILESTITRKQDWFVSSAGLTQMLIRASSSEEDYEEFKERILIEKIGKLTNKDFVMVNKKRKKSNLPVFKNLEQMKLYLINEGL